MGCGSTGVSCTGGGMEPSARGSSARICVGEGLIGVWPQPLMVKVNATLASASVFPVFIAGHSLPGQG
ncbi:hypothetical protein D3C83_93370 [compost metagenome]